MSPTIKKLQVEPYTQWAAGVVSPSSACGPTTMAAMAEYWNTRQNLAFIRGKSHFHSKEAHINYIYLHHGGAPWGMSVRGFIRGLKKYIGAFSGPRDGYRRDFPIITFNDFGRYKAEIDAGRPIAVKFDKWFSFHWKGQYAFDYHWVLGIGYEEEGRMQKLIVLDNGTRTVDHGYTPSQERWIDYNRNKPIVTMIGLSIEETPEPL
ncbi:C39 family peptidase [Paenibacillus sp. sgz500958]|uniref:C39 family peptidase n=1 Tax=Paenibacillus sp. sgz500958 TaxID=3242475 RepID=UPI0036D4128D